MRCKWWAALATVAAVTAAGCGGTSSSGSDADTASTGCGQVALGDQGNGTIHGIVKDPTNVACATAQTVVRAWGRQQIGRGTARLPAGWRCATGKPACRNGSQSVDLALSYP